MTLRAAIPALLSLLITMTSQAEENEITVFYAENPPLICTKDGKLDCISGKLINLAAELGKFKITPIEIPWSRSTESLSSTKNSIFASTGRNEHTENKYNWFFEVYSDDVNVWSLDSIKVKEDADISKLQTIAVRRGSPFADYLIKYGARDRIIELNDWVQATSMLEAGRVDALCLTELVGHTNLVNIARIDTNRINKFKVGEMSWNIITTPDVEQSPTLIEFNKYLAEAKKSSQFREYFLEKTGKALPD